MRRFLEFLRAAHGLRRSDLELLFPGGLGAAGLDLLTLQRAFRHARPPAPLGASVEADIAAIAAARGGDGPGLAGKTCALVALPRTGSTFVADLLAADGRFGRPAEHFNPRVFRRVVEAAGRDMSLRAYWRRVQRATAAMGGVAGVKVQTYHQLYWLKRRGFDLLELGFDRVYWLERADLEAQARSLATAFRTGIWHGAGPADRPSISPVEMRVARAALETHRAWFLARYGERVDRTFVLEEWSERPERIVETIAADLGLAPAPAAAGARPADAPCGRAADMASASRIDEG